VGDVEVTSDRVCKSVNSTDGRVGESHTSIQRSQKHLSSALSVLAVESSLMNVLGEESHGFSSERIGQRVLLVQTGVSFDSMDHGVDTGMDRNFLRDRSSKSSIKDSPVGQKAGGYDSSLDGLTALDNSNLSNFRASSSSSGNLNQRNSSSLSDSNSVDLVERGATVLFFSQVGDNLSDVHRRTATESNDAINFVLNAHGSSIIDVLFKRVGYDTIEDQSFDSSSLERC